MTFKQLISKRVRQLLKERQWTQYQLAIQSAIPFSTISYLLGKKRKSRSIRNAIKYLPWFWYYANRIFSNPTFRP